MDVAWKKGVVFTAKSDGLWEPTKRVGEEDIRHMRNRVEQFVFTAGVPHGSLKDIRPCATHMAKWIMDESAAADASDGLRPLPAAQHPADVGVSCEVAGFHELAIATKLTPVSAEALLKDLTDLGAVSVEELTIADWQSLPSWRELRMLPQRRLMQALFGPRASWSE